MNLPKKISLGFGLVLALSTLLGITGLWCVSDKSSSSNGFSAIVLATIAVLGVGIACAVVIVRGVHSALKSSVKELRQGAEQVADAAGQIASSSQSLAQGASEQAASLEETSASSEEITSMTRKNADNAQRAADEMGKAGDEMSHANQKLQQMVASMNQITSSSDKISKIIRVIDEIAFQTNILALNAAVEAARAGEAGMGFAVVADEVRNLAQRSAQAAKDTAALIEESINTASEGSARLEQVAGSIAVVTEHAGRVKGLIDEVNLGSQEQARGMEEIARSISQMEKVTQSAAAGAEQSASSSHQLNAQSSSMMEIVRNLETLAGLSSGESHAEARHGLGSHAHAGSQPRPLPARALTSLLETTAVQAPPPAKKFVAPPPDRSEIPLEDDFQEF